MTLLYLVIGVIGFGIMVFVHELGHFLAAKRVGIHVEAFSLGWGRKLVGFDYKGTNYRISVFPLGGYCRMKGEDPLHPEESDGKGGFFAAAPWKRILVSVSGPAANLLFALLALTVIWWAGFTEERIGNRIVLASDYPVPGVEGPLPAERAGLQTGDRIVAVGRRPVDSFQDLQNAVVMSPGKELSLTVERSGRTLQLEVVPELDRDSAMARIGVYAWVDPIVGAVREGGPADLAGLEAGDRILSADGKEIPHAEALRQLLYQRPSVLELTYERDDLIRSTSVVLSYSDEGVLDPGFAFRVDRVRSPRVGLLGALQRGAYETWDILVKSVKGIGMLFRGINLRRAVAGPLQIMNIIGEVATAGFSESVGQGFVWSFRIVSLISVVLFMVNLLPIPALDGGQILIFLVEGIRRRPVNREVIGRIQRIGFSVIVMLAIVVTFNDILTFFGR
ncbi:MAG: site-2 protease family protein [Spirochaetales bacterium]|nr:site-2 protease family protein [Spirochaetales bacterium]